MAHIYRVKIRLANGPAVEYFALANSESEAIRNAKADAESDLTGYVAQELGESDLSASTRIEGSISKSDIFRLLEEAEDRLLEILPFGIYLGNTKFGRNKFSIDLFENKSGKPYGGKYLDTFKFTLPLFKDKYGRTEEEQLDDALDDFMKTSYAF